MLRGMAHLIIDARLYRQLVDLAFDLFQLFAERFVVDALELLVEKGDSLVRLRARPVDLLGELGGGDSICECHRVVPAHLVQGDLVDRHDRIEELGLSVLLLGKQLVIADLLGGTEDVIEPLAPIRVDGAIGVVAQEYQAAALARIMVEPEVVHVLIFDARDGRDLGEDLLAH